MEHNSPLEQHNAADSKTILLAFDFDHTIVDANTDTWIIKAAPGQSIPAALQRSYVTGQWTQYMGRVLSHLHMYGVTATALQQVLQDMPYVEGMQELWQHLLDNQADSNYHCIILSDSNSHFIDWILTGRGHRALFSHIYTNKAELGPEGQLLLSPYHSHKCTSCPVNMCKRAVLIQHRELNSDVKYDRTVYVGDGSNDLCPAQALGPKDVVFVRISYALDKLMQQPAIAATIAAKVLRWNTAHEILQWLQQH